jgi:predicted nucleotidyltransferase
MKIDSTKTIGGVPLIKVRDLLRYMGAGTMGGERTLTREAIARRVGRDIADELVGEGLLQFREKDRDGGPWYEITDAAPRLANVKMLKRINRSKADLYVAELLRRADDINANAELLYRVKRITAFGSYITDAADLGDVDIAVELECKFPSGQRVEANKARARASGRLNLSLFDELSFGEREVKRLLRGRNRYISLTNYDSLEELRTPTKDIYPRPQGACDY